MAGKKSIIARKRKKEKRKKIIIAVSASLLGVLALTVIIWYSLFFFGVAKYNPWQILTGKNKPYCVISNYKGLTYTEVSDEVTESDYTEYYSSMLEKTPNYVADEGRAGTLVRSGDILNIDYEGKTDGVAFEGGTGTGYNLTIGSGTFIPGFEDALIGQTVGETVDIDVTFPEDYSVNANLAGKPAVFTVKINYVSKALDHVTDEYINKNTEYSTVQEYEGEYLTSYLTEKAKTEKMESEYEEVLKQLLDNTKFYNIDKETGDYYNTMMTYYTSLAKNTYGTTLENYANYVVGESLSAFRSEMRSVAEITIKQHYALEEVAKQEKLKVTDKVYEQYIESVMKENDYTDRAKFESENKKDKIEEMILWAYARDKVFSYAKKV